MAYIIYTQGPRVIRPVTGPSGRVYRFHHKGINNWMMEDVDERDVEAILNTKRGCCGAKGKFFRLATPEEIEAWEQNTLYNRRTR